MEQVTIAVPRYFRSLETCLGTFGRIRSNGISAPLHTTVCQTTNTQSMGSRTNPRDEHSRRGETGRRRPAGPRRTKQGASTSFGQTFNAFVSLGQIMPSSTSSTVVPANRGVVEQGSHRESIDAKYAVTLSNLTDVRVSQQFAPGQAKRFQLDVQQGWLHVVKELSELPQVTTRRARHEPTGLGNNPESAWRMLIDASQQMS